MGCCRMAESPISGADRYIVVVRNLVLLCSIGVRRVERERLQRVRISVELTDPAAALAQARRLVAGGADIVELGAAASNVAAKTVPAEEEIRRLDPVIAALKADGAAVSIDTFRPETQRFALARGVAYLNDIQG